MGAYRTFQLRRSCHDDVVRRCLADCGAASLAELPFNDLSGGQKQRVLIARALASEPEMLVLDEPLAGIDITTRQALLQLLKDIKERRRLTILMVSHRVSAEKGLFTHIAWVDEGRVSGGPAGEMLSTGRLSEIFKTEL